MQTPEHNDVLTILHNFRSFLRSIEERDTASFQEGVDRYLLSLLAAAEIHPLSMPQHLLLLRTAFAAEFQRGLLLRRIRNKPLGVALDYLVLDWLHTRHCSTEIPEKYWDIYLHEQPFARALRYCKEYFVELFTTEAARHSSALLVLHVSNTSYRDVYEALQETEDPRHCAHCLPALAGAQEYAHSWMPPSVFSRIRWEGQDAFRFQPVGTYRLVWSAGLLDFYSDRIAAAFIERLWGCTSAGGLLCVAGFHTANPSRLLMEWCLDWTPHHRSTSDMLCLCAEAGIPEECVEFDFDESGAMIFTKARKA